MMKTIIPSEVSTMELQRHMQSLIAPRPIALASTISAKGEVNLTPFSFFNMFSTQPPILIFSPSRRVRDNSTKHSLHNVYEVPEVVIGVVNYPIVQQTSLASTEYDEGINEFIKAGFTMKEADLVAPPLIEEAPANFECKVIEIKSLGNEGGAGNLVICEVLKIHIREEYLLDNGYPNQEKLNLVARLGSNWYSVNSKENLFEVSKPLVTKGIGFDQLPKEIRFSHVFTGNDLGMLANIENLPGQHFTSDAELHRQAQLMLHQNKIKEAWKLLEIDIC